MSQTTDTSAGPFSAAFENPFTNTQIPTNTNATFEPPQAQNSGFEMAQPQAPTNGVVQTQGSPGFMEQQVMGSEMPQGPFGNMSPVQQPTQGPFNPQPTQQPIQPQMPFNNSQPIPNTQQPNPFNNSNNSPFNNTGNSNGNGKLKYHIFDLGYLVNRRIHINGNLEGEAPIINIGYNASFGNMRISFKGTNEINAQSHYFTITKLISGGPTINIYPAMAEQILCSPAGSTIYLIDQLITAGNWTPSPAAICILDNNSYLLYAKDNNQDYKFTIMDYQINFFKHCLEYMINGGAWNALAISRMFS